MAKKHFLLPGSLVKKMPILAQPGWLLEALVLLSLIKVLRLFSPERGEKITRSIFKLMGPVLPLTGKMTANLCVAFPDKSAEEIGQLVQRSTGNLGSSIADLVFAQKIWEERSERIEFVFENGVNLADYQDQPVVMVTGHIGAWQIALFVARAHQLDITSVFAPEENPYIGDFIFALRKTMQSNWVSRDGCMKHLVRELKNKHAVGFTSDTRKDDGEAARFFNQNMFVSTAAARLAVRHQCDLLPVRAERLPEMRYRITVGAAIKPADSGSTIHEQARQMTAAMMQVFEAWITEKPDEWMCFSRRWPKEVYSAT